MNSFDAKGAARQSILASLLGTGRIRELSVHDGPRALARFAVGRPASVALQATPAYSHARWPLDAEAVPHGRDRAPTTSGCTENKEQKPSAIRLCPACGGR